MGIPFTMGMGFLFTATMGILFTMTLGIQLTISRSGHVPCRVWISTAPCPDWTGGMAGES